MCYRRSYDYTITPEQKEEFIKKIEKEIEHYWHSIIDNDYPYDMCRDKKVKTDHKTVFYKELYLTNDVLNNNIWYTIIKNSPKDQTIPEIQHLHFIKIIDEN